MTKDHISASLDIVLEDFDGVVPFNQRGGYEKARKLFGGELEWIMGELHEVLTG